MGRCFRTNANLHPQSMEDMEFSWLMNHWREEIFVLFSLIFESKSWWPHLNINCWILIAHSVVKFRMWWYYFWDKGRRQGHVKRDLNAQFVDKIRLWYWFHQIMKLYSPMLLIIYVVIFSFSKYLIFTKYSHSHTVKMALFMGKLTPSLSVKATSRRKRMRLRLCCLWDELQLLNAHHWLS